MMQKKQNRNKTSALRRKAEERFAELKQVMVKKSKGDTASLIHELQVHQIELEMQNEQLRQAQTIIEDSNKRFSDLYDFAPVGHLTVEKEGRIIEANLTAAQLLGVTMNSLINKPFNIFVHPSDKDVFLLHLRRLRKSLSETCEIRLVKKGAAFFDAQLVSTPLASGAAGAKDFLITMLDITARKLAEEKSAKHYAILQAVMESSDGPIFSVDRDYRYLCFNSRHAKAMKALYNADIKARHSVLDYHANDENRRVAKANIDKALGGKIVTVETYAGDENGNQRYFKISHNPFRGPGGEVIGVAVFASDLTEQKKADEVRARLSAIVENSYDAIFSKTLDGMIESWNVSAEKMYGYTEQEIKGRPVSILVPPGHVDETPDILKKIMAGGTVRDFETLRRKKDGGEIPVSLTVSPVKTAAGEIIGASTITRDITQRKVWEGSILDSNERLLVSNQELENLGHTLSHDLRGPIQGIEALTSMLLADYGEKLDPDGKEMLTKVHEGTYRIRDMISGLLNISRIAQVEMHREKIDITALVRAIIQEHQKAEPTRDAEISIEENLFAEADANLLRIALDNLIRNSWKFTGKRTKTIIKFGKKESRSTEAFFLRDNGAGFDMKYAYKIFGVFQRLHSDSEFTGTGVGLATVQKIIHRHGGEIWAEGEIDKGATFYFTLS